MLKGIKITLDKFYQYKYIIFSVQFLKLIIFFGLISYADMNGLFLFLFTLHRPVRNQPVNVTFGAVFTSIAL